MYIGWDFPSNNNGRIDGLNDSGIHHFTEAPIKSMTREVVQDSLDAAFSNGSVIVKFEFHELPHHSSLSRNFKALKATFEVIERIDSLEKSGGIEKITAKREFIRNLMKQVNFIGAITIWGSLSHEEAVEKLWEYVSKSLNIRVLEY